MLCFGCQRFGYLVVSSSSTGGEERKNTMKTDESLTLLRLLGMIALAIIIYVAYSAGLSLSGLLAVLTL